MKTYNVIIDPTAESDMRGIHKYISETLLEPDIAKRIYLSIKKQIMSLDQMPSRHKIVVDEVLAQRNVRALFVENYCAFYVVEETKKEVHVLRVLYKRREWQSLI